MHRFFVAGVLLAAALPAIAAPSNDAIVYEAPGAWVLAPPAASGGATGADVPLQIGYFDNQVHVGSDGTEDVYTAYRVKIAKPEALSAGNVTVTWQPDEGPITIHYLRVVRDGNVTDVLASTKFTVLQREEQLEQSMLNGQRTATLQVPGLQVGDEIDFAVTLRRRVVTFDGHVAETMQMPIMGSPGAFRFRLVWPLGRKVELQASADLALPRPVSGNDENVLEVTMTDPKGAIPTEGAPARYNTRRLIEYSDFGGWAGISHLMAPLFERAEELAPGSPVKAEAAAIAARTSDPVERAEAALKLVQDRIRYVYVGLDGGNYVPAGVEETWKRRFGDCKAKTVLLVALLRELGIEAQPALVNSNGGDGMDQRLPSPRVFDHAVVRAVVAGKVEWLDGTRAGDSYLDNLPLPFRWALPLDPEGSELEKIAPRGSDKPQYIGLVDIDATAGLDQDAHVSMQTILRGDDAFALRTRLAGLSADDADRGLKSYWRQQVDWLTPDKVTWSYDERRRAITLGVIGRGNPGWTGDARAGRSLTLLGAGFFAPDALRRPADQDQAAPWALEYPRFRCWATTIRLPKAENNLTWSLRAAPMNLRLGGAVYWRASGFSGNVVRTVMSRQSYEPEASLEEAQILNRAIPAFDNAMSSISEERARDVLKASRVLPFGDDVDWLNAPIPCLAK